MIDQRANLLRLMKLDDYLTWVTERLEINMRDDVQSQHDELVIRMSLADSAAATHISQSHL